MPLNCITSFDEENCMKIYEDMIESKWKTHQSIELVETNLVMWVWKRNKEVFTTKKTFFWYCHTFLLEWCNWEESRMKKIWRVVFLSRPLFSQILYFSNENYMIDREMFALFRNQKINSNGYTGTELRDFYDKG